MKIGLVLANVPGYSETFFRSKIAGLQKVGHQVVLFAGDGKSDFKLCKQIPAPAVSSNRTWQILRMLTRLLVLGLRTPTVALRFIRLERQSGRTMRELIENLYLNSHILPHRLDWLHFGFATMAIRRENVAKAIGAKMAISLRGYDIAIYPLKHPECYNLVWQLADKVHTISDDLLALAYKNGMSASTPSVKITPAIQTQQFQRMQPFPTSLRQPLRLLTVARLHWKKGLEYTLEALAMLAQSGVDFQYTIIGMGEEYERLVFAAHQLGIREKVHFAGRLPHEEVKQAMEDADIYLQYSISEGFCNAVLEAQAMGLLCIVSDAEGLPENVLYGQTGWVVPKRRPDLLVKQIMLILQMDNETLQSIRQKAMERVRKEYDIKKQIEQFIAFYQG